MFYRLNFLKEILVFVRCVWGGGGVVVKEVFFFFNLVECFLLNIKVFMNIKILIKNFLKWKFKF